MRLAVSLLLGTVLLAGCNNPCQRTCARMKNFAEECGFNVSDAEFDACIDEQSAATKEDKETCREFGSNIERTWDCDVAAEYWGAPEGS